MVFNLRNSKKVLAQIPPLGDVAYNEDNPLRMSFEMAAAKMLPFYKAQNENVTDINSAMAAFGLTPEQVIEAAMAVKTPVLQQQQDAVDTEQLVKDTIKTQEKGNKMTKPFNLKKAQLPVADQPPMDDMGLNSAPEIIGDDLQMQQDIGTREFANGADVQNWLTTEVDMNQALQIITSSDDGSGRADTAKELIEDFYTSMGEISDREMERKAGNIFDNLPDSLKVEETNAEQVPAEFKSFSEVEELLKILGEKTAQEHKKKKFNLKKTAQHKTLQNTILWGPGETRKVDPFLRQPVSDWHIVERNKGFGLVVDDVWNIDYETIWRENIMDKYSRPYKDADGNWVGGYIQKRFEVDKNIPENTNLQLKPGQLRRPVVPEHGTMESRLQAARSKGDIAGAVDTSKPFNWKTVQAKKKR